MNNNKYSFKHSNISLADYLKDRKFSADLKRREAAVLIKQAEAIEDELWELESSLLLVTDSSGGSPDA